MINTAFFGTSDKSVPLLEQLKTGSNLKLCITKTDRVVGRTKEVHQTKVKEWARDNKIEVLEINSFDETTTQVVSNKLSELQITVGVVADFSFIIPKQILTIPQKGLINIHFSKLPKYRGASPVQHTILNGESETAVTYMVMGEKMDEGDIIRQLPYPVSPIATTQELYEELFIFGAKHLTAVLTDHVEGKITPTKQDGSNATYCYSPTNPKSTLIAKQDAQLNWNENPIMLYRKIRAFNPWPIAWAYIQDMQAAGYKLKPSIAGTTKVKIISAKFENNSLVPLIVQPENKNRMDYTSFVNGYFEKI